MIKEGSIVLYNGELRTVLYIKEQTDFVNDIKFMKLKVTYIYFKKEEDFNISRCRIDECELIHE